MKRAAIYPFFFPTTVIFVDDSISFLSNLSLQLDSNLSFKLFNSPTDALHILHSSEPLYSMVKRLFSTYQHRDDLNMSRHVIDVNLDPIHREVHNEKRFEHISVVVVDYDMPEINGIDFCRNIKNDEIKKILLTGKADEQVAIRAFNEGLIDCFIRKQDADAITQLQKNIHILQNSYFSGVEHPLSDALSIASQFLSDASIVPHFSKICQELEIVEYYFTYAPNGVLMLDKNGVSYLFIIQSEDDLQSMYEIAFHKDAPDELLALIKMGTYIPYFWKTQGEYSTQYDWRNCLFPASEVQGRKRYFHALVKNPMAFNLQYITPYSEYLAKSDEHSVMQRAF